MNTTHTDWPVKELWVDTVTVRPVEVDWDIVGGEDREGFESYEAPKCDLCSEYGRFEHGCWICDNAECENHGAEIEDEYSEGPMMNYYYPLPDLRRVGDDPAEAATKIRDLPLCVIAFQDGSYALALTGGGMDLSWEISEAFTRLGYLPPLHFCDLPNLAGKRIEENERYVIAACLRSASVAEGWAQRARARLAEQYPEVSAEVES